MIWHIQNSDIDKIFKYPKYLLVITGVWPAVESKFTWLYILYRFLCTYFISCAFTATLVLNLYLSLDDIESAVDALYFTSTEVIFLMKLLLFYFKLNDFESLLSDLDNPLFIPTNLSHKKYMKAWKQWAHFYSSIYVYNVLASVTLFGFSPVVDENLLLPIPGWIPFDVKKSAFGYAVAYIFQMYGLSLCAAIDISFDMVPCVVMNVGCVQIDMLKYNFKNAIKIAEGRTIKKYEMGTKSRRKEWEESDENYFEPISQRTEKILLENLTTYVKHHEAIIGVFSKCQKIFNVNMFVQLMVTSVVTLCMTAMQIIVLPIGSFRFVHCLVYFFAILIGIAVYCFNGNHVFLQTSSIGDSCYEMEWYRCSPKVKRVLFIIMERCKTPVIITAGGILNCTLQTFTLLLRTSYSYFTVIYNMYSE